MAYVTHQELSFQRRYHLSWYTSPNLTGWPDLIRLSLEERCLWHSYHCTSSGDIISKFSITLCSIRLIFPRATGKSTVSICQSRFLTLIFPIVSISQHTCFFDVTILLLAVPTEKCTVTTRLDQKKCRENHFVHCTKWLSRQYILIPIIIVFFQID